MPTTFTITAAERERIIVDNEEKLKVTAVFSNGETRSYHFPLAMSKTNIEGEIAKAAALFDLESEQAKANASREKAEAEADATAAALLA